MGFIAILVLVILTSGCVSIGEIMEVLNTEDSSCDFTVLKKLVIIFILWMELVLNVLITGLSVL